MDPRKRLEKHDTELSRVTQSIVESCGRQRGTLDVEIGSLAVELRRSAFENEMARRLKSLPGVGPTVAAAIAGYIRDSTRFSEAMQVARYDGPDASVHESGEEDCKGESGGDHRRFYVDSWRRQLTRLPGVAKVRLGQGLPM